MWCNWIKQIVKPWSVFVAGFQFSVLIIGKQTWPFSSIFGWKIFVLKFIRGGLNGYSAGKWISIRKAPLLYGGFSYNINKFLSNICHKQREQRFHYHTIWLNNISCKQQFWLNYYIILTGTINPVQNNKFCSSTVISLNDLNPEDFKSVNS